MNYLLVSLHYARLVHITCLFARTYCAKCSFRLARPFASQLFLYFWYRFHRFSTMRTSVRITLPVRLYHVYYVLTM